MLITTKANGRADSQLELFTLSAWSLPHYAAAGATGLPSPAPWAGLPVEEQRQAGIAVLPAQEVVGRQTENGRDALPALPPMGTPGLGDLAGASPALGNWASALPPPVIEIAEPGVPVVIEEPPTVEPEPLCNQRNYRITDADKLGVGSLKQKCRHNFAAIELLKKLEADGRDATEADKRVRVRYVGWGGLPQVFDAWNEQWTAERERLEQLLTPDELDSARATTLNAHYTAPVVIRAMYALLKHVGFKSGRLLEPALGLGHFVGLMPDDMHSQSLITGIEIDGITTRLAKMLYPDADIRHQPFEESKLADGFYDLALGNIPFGDFTVADPRFKAWKFLIHDYFFAAAVNKVRPGGLVVFITSKGTFDKTDTALSEYVGSQADLLGAIRLPNDAFKKNANTEVTADIVVLRKRLPGELPSGPTWKAIGELTNSLGETIPVNEYFAAHPEMMLGELRLEGRMYGRSEPTLVGNCVPLEQRLAEAIARLPEGVFQADSRRAVPVAPAQSFPAPEHIKIGRAHV